MRTVFFFLCIAIHFNSFGQTGTVPKYLELKEYEKQYYIGTYVEYFIDSTRSLSFEEVKNKKFYTLQNPPTETQAIVWYKFYTTPKTTSKQLIFTPNVVDLTDVYIPYKNGYKQYEVGVLTETKMKHLINDVSVLNLSIDSLDFTKPFYYNKRLLGFNGKAYSKQSGILFLTNNPNNWYATKLIEYVNTSIFKSCLAIVFISFLLFLVSFLVTKDKNFLHYSLYLFFTSLIFAILFPSVYNFINSIHPFILNYIGTVSVIMASVTYFYFVIYFVELKNKNQKMYQLAKYTVIFSLAFALLKVLQMLFVPYFAYRYLLLDIYNIVFLIISIIVFIYLMFTPLSIAKRIVVIGSLFLIIGQILSVVFALTFFFIGAVIIEIIIFSGVVSYQNRITNNKKILSESALEIEKNKRENLQELNELKSKFFSNISHEFRTPLTLISGPIQQQLQKKNLPVDERNNLEMMQRNSDRLLSLVDQLLSVSKIEAGKVVVRISNNDISSFVETLIDNFRFTTKQKLLKFTVAIEPTLTETWFDKDIVEKIITNLVSNAVKYTPENGEIVCEAFVKDNQFYFEIKNTATQLIPEQVERLFDRFYQMDRHKEGTGIGLSLVKEIVKLHKGTITATSVENWITFKVVLPIAKDDFEDVTVEEITELKSVEKEIVASNTILETENDFDDDTPILLIVEDNTDVRMYVDSIFKHTYKIIHAQNGQEGIALAIEHVPDIIISDIMMPIKNGIELCNILKTDERTSHIPIILLTAKAGEQNEIEGVKTGADDYITKPFNNELLKLKVENLLENIKKLQQRFSQEVLLKPTEISVSSTDDLFLNRLQNVLDDKLVESTFNTDDFCKSIHMSRMQLHRKLKALFNMTTTEFIRSQRLKLAADLLKTSDVAVSQVGYSVGFNDPAYFSKRFKEVYNCTPTQYAKRDN